jgi:predicted nucleotide-binding protein
MDHGRTTVIARLRSLISDAEGLSPSDVERWRQRARMAVIAAYGESSSHVARFDKIRYSLGIWTESTPRSAVDTAALGGVRKAVAMLDAFVEDLDQGDAEIRPAAPGGRQVFVVHGHDDGMREQVASLLRRLHLEPVILQQEPDQGRTIIEKFEAHALEVGYAVVLLSPDDFGKGPDQNEWPSKPNRARQNVVLELGYFMGSLGRARTAALYRSGAELPSDIHGLLYVSFDDADWQLRLAREMRAARLPVDLNDL